MREYRGRGAREGRGRREASIPVRFVTAAATAFNYDRLLRRMQRGFRDFVRQHVFRIMAS